MRSGRNGGRHRRAAAGRRHPHRGRRRRRSGVGDLPCANGCGLDPAKVSLTGVYLGQAAALGSALYLALVGLLALGVATAVRDSAAAIGIVLGLLFLFPLLIAISTGAWRRHLEQIAPMPAGLDIQATVNIRALPLTPWQGLGVLAAWATGALILGGLALRLRDASAPLQMRPGSTCGLWATHPAMLIRASLNHRAVSGQRGLSQPPAN